MSSSSNRFKQKCLAYLEIIGCELCGYDRYLGAVEFHHVLPENKKFTIASRGRSGTLWPEVKRELAKCVALCANCHRELHGNMIPQLQLTRLIMG